MSDVGEEQVTSTVQNEQMHPSKARNQQDHEGNDEMREEHVEQNALTASNLSTDTSNQTNQSDGETTEAQELNAITDACSNQLETSCNITDETSQPEPNTTVTEQTTSAFSGSNEKSEYAKEEELSMDSYLPFGGLIPIETTEEREALNEFMKRVNQDKERFNCIEVSEENATFHFGESTFLRFLRARRGDVSAAMEMLENHIKWRNIVRPASIQSDPDGDTDMPPKELEKFVAYVMEKLLRKGWDYKPNGTKLAGDNQPEEGLQPLLAHIPGPREKIVLLVDLSGFSLSSHFSRIGVKRIRQLVSMLQCHYPEILHTLIFYNSPMLFSTAWKVISRWLDPGTLKKVFIGNKKSIPSIHALINPDDLLEAYYGNRTEPYPELREFE